MKTDFMPWRDQLRLAWKAVRWLYWPSSFPLWANVATSICSVTLIVCVLTGNLWGVVGTVVVCVAIGAVMHIRGEGRS